MCSSPLPELLVIVFVYLLMYLMRLLCKLVNLSSVKDKQDSTGNGSQSKREIVYILGILLMNNYTLIFSGATLFSAESLFLRICTYCPLPFTSELLVRLYLLF